MHTLSAIIFDLGGVFTYPQRLDKVAELMALLGTKLEPRAFRAAYSRHRLEYDRGIIDADEYWREVARSSGAKDGAAWPKLLPLLVRADIESWFNIRPGMVELAARLKGEVGRIALLSNINRECVGHLESNYDWLGLFDALVYSCDHRLLKPERGIFELCLGLLGLPAELCLFVDDIEENVEGARSAGLRSMRFVDEEGFREELARSYGLEAAAASA
jgi:putative hydrolase of the HAD superfamily